MTLAFDGKSSVKNHCRQRGGFCCQKQTFTKIEAVALLATQPESWTHTPEAHVICKAPGFLFLKMVTPSFLPVFAWGLKS